MKIISESTLSEGHNNPVGYDVAQKVVYRKNIAADALTDETLCKKTLAELLGDKLTDEAGPFNYYKKLTALRKENKATLVYGNFRPIETNDETYCFYRESAEGKFYIEMNLTENEIDRPKQAEGECALSNYSVYSDKLRAYEVNIYKMKPAE